MQEEIRQKACPRQQGGADQVTRGQSDSGDPRGLHGILPSPVSHSGLRSEVKVQIQRLSAMILGKKKKCQSIAYNEILRKSVLFNNGFCEDK